MIYTADNIKIPASAFCNSVEIDEAISVDTSKGEILYAPRPVRVKKNTNEIYTRKVRGKCWVVNGDGVKNP